MIGSNLLQVCSAHAVAIEDYPLTTTTFTSTTLMRQPPLQKHGPLTTTTCTSTPLMRQPPLQKTRTANYNHLYFYVSYAAAAAPKTPTTRNPRQPPLQEHDHRSEKTQKSDSKRQLAAAAGRGRRKDNHRPKLYQRATAIASRLLAAAGRRWRDLTTRHEYVRLR